MIKFANQVPSIYTNASRDFQYIGWLVDVVLNSVKHNVDSLYNLPHAENNSKITELLAITLGFKIKRNYDKKQLAALVSILPAILKYKGTEKAITMAAAALIKASGASGDFSCTVKDAKLEVILPRDLIDITLFTDLLEYILPAGMTYRIFRDNQSKQELDKIQVGHSDFVKFDTYNDLVKSNTNLITGLSVLYPTEDIEETRPEFAANFKHINGVHVLNSGLLNNTIIPVVETDIASDNVETKFANMISYDGKLLYDNNGRLLLAAEENT